MDLSFLPTKYLNALNTLNLSGLYEIRIRVNFPIRVNYYNSFVYLNEDGITMFEKNAIITSQTDIDYIINKVTEHSIYAYNESIKRGYLTTITGIRIGLGGECVTNGGQVNTIKNFTSLNIRIPHKILKCANKCINYINSSRMVIYNSLIISPPACGKTTILKDLVRVLNLNENISSILIIDERGEFKDVCESKVDKIEYSDKTFAFNSGLRALSPQIVITDELVNEDDWKCVYNATNSGVKIIATCHGENIDNVKNKSFFVKNIFDRYIILKNKIFSGEIDQVFDKDFNIIT